MKLLQIVGARPQFIKLAAVFPVLSARGHTQVLVHTGQHFDDAMSRVFFEELGIPVPQFNLGVHSLPHGAMTGRMLEKVEEVMLRQSPDAVIVYGDTDSTLAGALAAAKLAVPIAHVEAGLRSHNRAMPEELNRVVADHMADLLLAPTEAAMKNLEREGLASRAHLVGDVMYDVVLRFASDAATNRITAKFAPQDGQYVLATVHRAAATRDPAVLAEILGALDDVARDVLPVILPLHPGTRQALDRHGIRPTRVHIVEPVSYLEMMALLRGSAAVLTDSGGLQKEAYFAGKVCFTMRGETEWVETVACGANVVCGESREGIAAQVRRLESYRVAARFGLPLYGSGDAAVRIADLVEGMGAGRARGDSPRPDVVPCPVRASEPGA